MATQANIEDTEALERLRVQLIKYVEVLSSAVAEAAGDVNRMAQWLELDRTQHWRLELRKREEKYQQALEALRMKQLFKGPSGERQSVVDEQKRVKICRAMVEEAQMKQKAVASHKNRLAREKILFQGALSRIGSIANQTGPLAIAELKHMILALEKYGKITAEAASEAAASASTETAVTRTPAEASTPGADASSPAQPEQDLGVQWEEVQHRAKESKKRVDGEVVVEVGALLGGRAVLLRDFLKGKIYIAHPTPPHVESVQSSNWEVWPLSKLLQQIVGLAEIFEKPGDRRVVLEENRVIWHD